MKKIMTACIIALSIFTLSACSDNKADDEILATTKSGNVTKEDLYNEMKNSIGAEVLENLVLKTVIEEEFKLSEEELNEAIKKQKDMHGDSFEQYLEQKNYTEDFFNKQIEFSLLQQKLIQSLDVVTEEEVKEEYEKMKIEIHARHILLEDKETAEKILAKLKDGENFSTLAKENTIEPVGQRNGGDLGWFSPGKMVQEFDDVAFELDIDEISDPVQTSYGYHIIQLLEKQEKELEKSLEELTPQIEDRLYEQRFDEKVAQLFKDANLEIKDKSFKTVLNNYLNENKD